MTDSRAKRGKRPSEALELARGVRGYAPPGKFENLDVISCILGLFWLKICCILNVLFVQKMGTINGKIKILKDHFTENYLFSSPI